MDSITFKKYLNILTNTTQKMDTGIDEKNAISYFLKIKRIASIDNILDIIRKYCTDGNINGVKILLDNDERLSNKMYHSTIFNAALNCINKEKRFEIFKLFKNNNFNIKNITEKIFRKDYLNIFKLFVNKLEPVFVYSLNALNCDMNLTYKNSEIFNYIKKWYPIDIVLKLDSQEKYKLWDDVVIEAVKIDPSIIDKLPKEQLIHIPEIKSLLKSDEYGLFESKILNYTQFILEFKGINNEIKIKINSIFDELINNVKNKNYFTNNNYITINQDDFIKDYIKVNSNDESFKIISMLENIYLIIIFNISDKFSLKSASSGSKLNNNKNGIKLVFSIPEKDFKNILNNLILYLNKIKSNYLDVICHEYEHIFYIDSNINTKFTENNSIKNFINISSNKELFENSFIDIFNFNINIILYYIRDMELRAYQYAQLNKYATKKKLKVYIQIYKFINEFINYPIINYENMQNKYKIQTVISSYKDINPYNEKNLLKVNFKNKYFNINEINDLPLLYSYYPISTIVTEVGEKDIKINLIKIKKDKFSDSDLDYFLSLFNRKEIQNSNLIEIEKYFNKKFKSPKELHEFLITYFKYKLPKIKKLISRFKTSEMENERL